MKRTYTPRRTRKGIHPNTMAKIIRVWKFILDYKTEHDYAPSTADIITAGLAHHNSVAIYYLRLMAQEGILERTPGTKRAIRVLPLKKQHKPIYQEICNGTD